MSDQKYVKISILLLTEKVRETQVGTVHIKVRSKRVKTKTSGFIMYNDNDLQFIVSIMIKNKKKKTDFT